MRNADDVISGAHRSFYVQFENKMFLSWLFLSQKKIVSYTRQDSLQELGEMREVYIEPDMVTLYHQIIANYGNTID